MQIHGDQLRIVRHADAGPTHHVLAGEREWLVFVQRDEAVGFEEMSVDADLRRIGHRQAEREAAGLAVAGERGRAADLDLL